MPERALRTAAAVAVVMAATTALAGPAAQAAPLSTAATAATGKADYNGDGITDVAVTAPGATVSGKPNAGYVAVVYGTAAGVPASVKQVIHQDTTGIPGTAEQDDRFGSAVASGDLDGDGYTDLVVGSAGEAVGDLHSAGSLTVVWGGANGLSTATVVKGTSVHQDLGEAAAVGDFDADGHLDIATGTTVGYGPFTRTGGAARTESMTVRVDDTTTQEDILWGRPVLAAGDVNGDGVTDLVAVIEHGSGELPYDGPRLAQYLQGAPSGLSAARTLKEADGTPLDGGESVAVGDLDRDGYADIVLGRASEYDMTRTDEVNKLGGAVEIVGGSATGPDTTGPRPFIHQDTPGVPGTAEAMDGFGVSVSLGDVDRDGHLDLAVGAAYEDVGTVMDAGSVTVLKGGATGLTGTGAVTFTQDTGETPGTAEKYDSFGSAVKLADVTGDGRAELFAGTPNENAYAGGVWAFPATASGVTATGSYAFGAGTLGTVVTRAELGSSFGD